MKIYTKTGDKGTTRLVDGSCVEKFNPRVEAYGCVDELNSLLGLTLSHLNHGNEKIQSLAPLLTRIQNELFNVGSLLATEKPEVFEKLPPLEEKHILALEKAIDQYTEGLPTLKNFILPGGHLVASSLHMCRTFCRRAERRTTEVAFMAQQKGIDNLQNVVIYLNRLSDLFFTLARWVNWKTEHLEVIWKKDHEA